MTTTAADTPPEKTDKRDAILEAAVALFAERGFHGTTVPDVATKAKVGAGTIYRYFPSKEALVNALFRLHKERLRIALLGGLDPELPTRTFFHEFWRRACLFARDNSTALEFLELQRHATYLDEESLEFEGALLEAARVFIARGVAKQILRDVNPTLLVAIRLGRFSRRIRRGMRWIPRSGRRNDRRGRGERLGRDCPKGLRPSRTEVTGRSPAVALVRPGQE